MEHQPYLRDVERQHVYFVMMGDYRHGDCGFLNALARYSSSSASCSPRELEVLPVTITHITFVKSDATYDPDATLEAWSQKLEVEFEFGDFDHSPGQMCVVRRRQTLMFRRYSAATLASFFS